MNPLTDLQKLVLRVVADLHGEGHAITILNGVEVERGRLVGRSIGKLSTALRALLHKKMITRRIGRRIIYSVTERGRRALERHEPKP